MYLEECLTSSPQTQAVCYLLLAFLPPRYEGVSHQPHPLTSTLCSECRFL